MEISHRNEFLQTGDSNVQYQVNQDFTTMHITFLKQSSKNYIITDYSKSSIKTLFTDLRKIFGDSQVS